MIKKDEVKKVAKLARLGLGEGEIEKYQKELSKVLDYIDKLKELDVSGISPTSHPSQLKNAAREDIAEKKNEGNKLVGLAPDKKNGYVKVKAVLK